MTGQLNEVKKLGSINACMLQQQLHKNSMEKNLNINTLKL